MAKIGIFVIFMLIRNNVYCQNREDSTEFKRFERVIMKNIDVPRRFMDERKAVAFTLRYSLSNEHKTENVKASKNAPIEMIQKLLSPNLYSKIIWEKLISNHSKTIVILITIYPNDKSGLQNDKSETLTYFTSNQINELFDFDEENNAEIYQVLSHPISIEYSDVIR